MFKSSGVVNILDKNNKSIGTGFFTSPEFIFTCLHVLTLAEYAIKDSVKFRFSVGTTSYDAVWIDASSIDDIAILKSTIAPNQYYKLSSSIGYEGQIESFGFPNGKKNGIYARAEVYGSVTTPDGVIQLQLGNANDITHGFSGAPIVSNLGNIIGMVSNIPKQDAQNRLVNIAFAIPSSKILNLFSTYSIVDVSIDEDGENEGPKAVNLIGRETEMLYYTDLVSKNNVTVIQGMAGVGKTTLAAHLFATVINSPKLWITIRPDINNELEAVIYDISDYLARYGYLNPISMFQDLENSSQSYEVALLNIQTEIIRCVSELNLAIFIDDAHLISGNNGATSFLLNLIHSCTYNKFVFITRHSLDFIPQTANIKSLKGLIKKDCKKIIERSGLTLSDSHIQKIYEKTQGNAKFLEICIFSLLESDRETIENIINSFSLDFNLSNYIKANILDKFTDLELKILKIIALCRKPILFDVILRLCESQFEKTYYILDKLVRRNIVEKMGNDFYSMHALLKEQFIQLAVADNLVLHQRIAENIEQRDYVEISYHYASCGRLSKALTILISNFDELISGGSGAVIHKQILSYQKILQKDETAQYNFLLGKLLITRGEYDLAIQAFKDISDDASQELIFDKFIQLSKCYEKKGDYPNAFDALTSAENRIGKTDKFKSALIDINKGFILCHQEKISKGIALCERGLPLVNSQPNISNSLVADGYNDLGWNYIIKGAYAKAVIMLKTAMELYTNNSRGLTLAKIRLARIHWQKGELQEGLEEINKAEELSILTGDPQLQAFALRQKNLILWSFGEFEIALTGHKESLKKYSKIKDYWGIAASLENVGATLYDLGNYEQAMNYIENAIKICNKIGATDFLAYAYLYKSRILSIQGHLVAAKKYAKYSINLLRKWRYSGYYMGMALISLGLAYYSEQKFIAAFTVFAIACTVLSHSKAYYQQHIADYYKVLCLRRISKRKIDPMPNPEVLKCYEYFNSIGATKMVSYLNRPVNEWGD